MLFLKGKEIGRSVTALGEFTESKQGKHDGLFAIKIKNDYDLSLNNLNAAPKSPAKFASHEEFFGSNYFYQWIDKMEEGGLYRIPVPSKNIEYVIKVVAGDVARLPPELKVPNSTLLKNDSTIVVSLNDSTGQASADANAKIQNVKYGSGTQTLDMSKITVPLNNCGGNAAVSQKYIQTQTFIHQFAAEIGFRLGVEIPLGAWLKLVPELQTKYGYEHGQIDTRTVEYAMVANARTNVVYTVLWKEQWESGTANLTSGKDNIAIPFRVRTNLISQIDSQSLPCN